MNLYYLQTSYQTISFHLSFTHLASSSFLNNRTSSMSGQISSPVTSEGKSISQQLSIIGKQDKNAKKDGILIVNNNQ